MADKTRGYISLWRSFTEWEWYDDIPTKVVFIHLLLNCTHTPIKKRGIEYLKGQYPASLRKIADETGLSIQQVRRAINNLECTNEITRKQHGKITIFTINNWCEYQEQNTKRTRSQHDDNTMTTQSLIDNNINNKITIISNRGNKIPPTLEELETYITENNYNVDAKRFIDFYESKGWLIGKNKMKDWKAAVRTWNSKEPQKPKPQKDIKDISLEDIYNGKY